MRRAALMLLIGLFLLAAGLTWHQARLARPGALVAHFLDAGQGDSALLVTPSGKQIVIDGGRETAVLGEIAERMPFFDRSIDLLVLSHPQLDHLFVFPELLRRYEIGAVLMTGVAYDLARYEEFLSLLREQNIPVLLADPEKDIDLGDGARLDVLWPQPGLLGRAAKEVNNTSIALKATYGSSSILFTGDMEEEQERAMLGAGVDVDADILKVAHHGSRTSTSTGFLLAVSPDLAVISAGARNSYGHPHPWVLARLRYFGIPVRVTAREGTVSIRLEQAKTRQTMP